VIFEGKKESQPEPLSEKGGKKKETVEKRTGNRPFVSPQGNALPASKEDRPRREGGEWGKAKKKK